MNVWQSPEFDAHEQVCFFTDAATGLHSIVAISGLEATLGMPGRQTATLKPLAEQLAGIHDRLCEIFARSATEHRPPEVVAEQMARELIGR